LVMKTAKEILRSEEQEVKGTGIAGEGIETEKNTCLERTLEEQRGNDEL